MSQVLINQYIAKFDRIKKVGDSGPLGRISTGNSSNVRIYAAMREGGR